MATAPGLLQGLRSAARHGSKGAAPAAVTPSREEPPQKPPSSVSHSAETLARSSHPQPPPAGDPRKGCGPWVCAPGMALTLTLPPRVLPAGRGGQDCVPTVFFLLLGKL